MRIVPILSALVFGTALLLGADDAEARIQGEGLCERQLDDCLRRSRIPEPCYWQYEACVSGSLYAPIPRSGSGLRGIRD
jgi:hypothetical protein